MVVARRDERAVRRAGKAFLDAFRAMLANEAPGAAAAISYFSLLALFPAILVLIAVADAFLGSIDLRDRVLQSILSLFPGSRSFIRSNFEEITAPSPHIVFSCMVIVVWSSTWVFVFVENALNRAWGVPKRRTFWLSRFRSFALLSLSGILLLTSAAITGTVSAFRSAADRRIPDCHSGILDGLQADARPQGALGRCAVWGHRIRRSVGNRQLCFRKARSSVQLSAGLRQDGRDSCAPDLGLHLQ